MPTETITHGPVECALTLLERSGGRQIKTLRFGVSPIVVTIADERFERFGLPSSELEARFDTRYCAAAAWLRGRFTLAEMREAAYTDPDIVALRSRVELVPDENRATFDGCWLEASYADGSTDRVNLDAFTGSVGKPLTDEQLTAVFQVAADGFIARERAQRIAASVWALDTAPSTAELMGLLAG